MKLLKGLWVASRFRTLALPLMLTLLGAIPLFLSGDWNFINRSCFILIMVHMCGYTVACNVWNDIIDFKENRDTEERKQKHSCQQKLLTIKQAQVFLTIIVSISWIAGGIVWWVKEYKWGPIFFSLAILGAYVYSKYPKKMASKGFGELSAFMAFGIPTVLYIMRCLKVDWGAQKVWLAGLMSGMMSVVLMLSNNIRDYQVDEKNGKRTLVHYVGGDTTVSLYLVLLMFVSLCLWVIFPYQYIAGVPLVGALGLYYIVKYQKLELLLTLAGIMLWVLCIWIGFLLVR